jgi:hypothetical protein
MATFPLTDHTCLPAPAAAAPYDCTALADEARPQATATASTAATLMR